MWHVSKVSHYGHGKGMSHNDKQIRTDAANTQSLPIPHQLSKENHTLGDPPNTLRIPPNTPKGRQGDRDPYNVCTYRMPHPVLAHSHPTHVEPQSMPLVDSCDPALYFTWRQLK
jgi:hypothetical protein